MQVTTRNPIQNLWLSLLVVFVLGTSVSSPSCLAECQPLEIELASNETKDASKDDFLHTRIEFDLVANKSLLFSFAIHEDLSRVTGNDAYLSIILHGPPTRAYPV